MTSRRKLMAFIASNADCIKEIANFVDKYKEENAREINELRESLLRTNMQLSRLCDQLFRVTELYWGPDESSDSDSSRGNSGAGEAADKAPESRRVRISGDWGEFSIVLD